jgi:MHS family proline/betaine transporter-like MFS transporter
MTTHRPHTPKVLLAGMAGNLLEWFDFAVYGFFAVIIGKLFFPQEDPVAQVIAAFGVFAVGFLMRPVGGMLLGHIGDKHGRHVAMMISVAAMAIPTFLVGILPGYETLGLAAPILLLLLRMIQGLSVGGEYTTSVVYMVEHAPAHRRGFVGSFATFGAVGGMLLGSAIGALLATVLTPEQLDTWGWRIPFVFGLVLGLAGLFLRRDDATEAVVVKKTSHPLVTALRDHWDIMLRISGVSMINAVVFYVLFVYLVSWLEMVDGIAPASALEINTVSMILLLPVMVAAGWLSDRVGAKPLLVFSSALIAVLAWPLFWLMHTDQVLAIQAGQALFALVIGVYLGVQPAYMVNMVPAHVRCSATGLAYNLTLGIAGGLSPMAATWLVHRTHDDLSPAYLVIAAALISLIALLTDRRPANASSPGAVGRQPASHRL